MIPPINFFFYIFSVTRKANSVEGVMAKEFSRLVDRFGTLTNFGFLNDNPGLDLDSGWLTILAAEPPMKVDHSVFDRTRQPAVSEEARNRLLRVGIQLQDPNQVPTTVSPELPSAKPLLSPPSEVRGWTVFVGYALQDILSSGDILSVWRVGSGDCGYQVRRADKTLLAAGGIQWNDRGGTCAVWQERDHERIRFPEPSEKPPGEPTKRKASINLHRSFVTARIGDKVFQLCDGDEISIDPFYLFLARSNKDVPIVSFEYVPQAVYAIGRCEVVGKEAIRTATTPFLDRQSFVF